MLTASLDCLLAAVAPAWALRRDRARRQCALEAQYADEPVRWIDGEPWVRGADGMSWIRLPGSRSLPPPATLGFGWRPSTFWPRRPEPALDPATRFRRQP